MTPKLDIRDLAKVVGFRVVYRSDSRGWHIALLTGIHTGDPEHPEQDLAHITFPDPIDGVSGDWIPIGEVVPFLRPLHRLLKEDALEILQLILTPDLQPTLEANLEIHAYRDGNNRPEQGVKIAISHLEGQPIELYMNQDLQIKLQSDSDYIIPRNMIGLIDLLTKKGYDVRGWIEKGLALDLTTPGQDTVPI